MQHFVWVLFLILISKYVHFYIGLNVIEFNATIISLTSSCPYCYTGLWNFLSSDSKFNEIISLISLTIPPIVGHLAFYWCLLFYFIVNTFMMLKFGPRVWSLPDKSLVMNLHALLFNVQCLDFLNFKGGWNFHGFWYMLT